MRLPILSLTAAAVSALALAACGEAPAKPAEPAPAADAHSGHGPMDAAMQNADAADDASQAETPNGFMYHTDTSKTETIHLPTGPGVTWTVTPENPTQVEFTDAADVVMADGTTHHVITFKPLTSGVIAKVKLEKREGANPEGPVVETRNINVMIH
jgi:hypothetical protein